MVFCIFLCSFESIVVVPNVNASRYKKTEKRRDRDSHCIPRPHLALAITSPLPYRHSSSPYLNDCINWHGQQEAKSGEKEQRPTITTSH
jgi:hypothetical protein